MNKLVQHYDTGLYRVNVYLPSRASDAGVLLLFEVKLEVLRSHEYKTQSNATTISNFASAYTRDLPL